MAGWIGRLQTTAQSTSSTNSVSRPRAQCECHQYSTPASADAPRLTALGVPPRLTAAVPYLDRATYYPHFYDGHQPRFERGVRFEVIPDDGSREWADLHNRLKKGPIRE